MSSMHSREEIRAAVRARGHTEEEIQRIVAGIEKLRANGLVRTSQRGASVGLTAEGRRKVAELKSQGVIPRRR